MNSKLQLCVLVGLISKFKLTSSLACVDSPGITFKDCNPQGLVGNPPVKFIKACSPEIYNGGGTHAYRFSDENGIPDEFELKITAITHDPEARLLLKQFKCGPGEACKSAEIGPDAPSTFSITMNRERFSFSSKSSDVSVAFYIDINCGLEENELDCSTPLNNDQVCHLPLNQDECIIIDKTQKHLSYQAASDNCQNNHNAELKPYQFTKAIIDTILSECGVPQLDDGSTSLWVGNKKTTGPYYGVDQDTFAINQPDWTTDCMQLFNMQSSGHGGFGFHDVTCGRSGVGSAFFQKGGYALCFQTRQ